jgi:hypothetical protein
MGEIVVEAEAPLSPHTTTIPAFWRVWNHEWSVHWYLLLCNWFATLAAPRKHSIHGSCVLSHLPRQVRDPHMNSSTCGYMLSRSYTVTQHKIAPYYSDESTKDCDLAANGHDVILSVWTSWVLCSVSVLMDPTCKYLGLEVGLEDLTGRTNR